MIVCRTHKGLGMKSWAFYYYHVDCWDAKEHSYARLVPLADVAMNATCCGCWKTIHNADESMAHVLS